MQIRLFVPEILHNSKFEVYMKLHCVLNLKIALLDIEFFHLLLKTATHRSWYLAQLFLGRIQNLAWNIIRSIKFCFRSWNMRRKSEVLIWKVNLIFQERKTNFIFSFVPRNNWTKPQALGVASISSKFKTLMISRQESDFKLHIAMLLQVNLKLWHTISLERKVGFAYRFHIIVRLQELYIIYNIHERMPVIFTGIM